MGNARTERRGRLALLVAVLAVPLTLGFAPAGPSAGASATSLEAAPALERADLVDAVLDRTNADRAAAGLDALELDRILSRHAVRHSARMAELGLLFHSREPRLRAALDAGRWSVAGENVGVGRSVREVQGLFLDSPSHRANVLGTYERVAIGVVEADGVLWITVIFAAS